jgi:general stress protein 26
MSQPTIQEMLTFLQAHPMGVVATVDADNKPEAAYVAYVTTENCEMVIGTSGNSRKAQNLRQNSGLAFVVADFTGEVQYEGEATVITADEYERLFTDGQLPKLSGFDKYRDDPTQIYIRIKPTWARFIVHGDTDQVVEFTEFA